VPPLPPKKLLGCHSVDFLQQRQALLNKVITIECVIEHTTRKSSQR
jgi:hypothetical protein